MNLSHQDQNMHSSVEGSLEDDKPDATMPCFRRNVYEEPLSSYSNGSFISQLLRKTIHTKRTLDESHFFLISSAAGDSKDEDQGSVSSKDSTVEAASPSAHVSTVPNPEGDHPVTDDLQAKRARVENIIRVMAGSPNSRHHGEPEKPDTPDTKDTREAREAYRENKRKQRLPQHQEHSVEGPASRRSSNSEKCTSKDEECHKLKEQLHSMQRLLRQLQEKFLQVYKQDEVEHNDRDEMEVTGELDVLGDKVASLFVGTEENFDRRSNQGAAECKDQIKVAGYLLHQRESQNLQEALKQELAKAVNDCVDRVFKKVSSAGLDLSPQQRMCSSPEVHLGMSTDRKSQQGSSAQEQPQSLEAAGRPHSLDYDESSEAQSPQDQTEALSLVVRKPAVTPMSSVTPTVKRPYPVHQTPFQFNYGTPLHDNQILEHLLKYGPHTNFGGLPCIPPSLDRTSPDAVELPWESIAMRSKVTSSHLGHHTRPSGMGAVTVDSLCLPHVKIECGELQSMAERNPYMSLNVHIQEGLTPSHLKKAKLMFFYTRYPSSNVLKTFFPDVKFNRCITSQLIKWFSNFREFYYIQMEKFARQAIVDGTHDENDITVSRDSELFRALNMHYNKANDFHVPNRFLEVAEITLHEFFNALYLGKDSDPSWKKAIYKVICKLDSDVPEEFKTSSYL